MSKRKKGGGSGNPRRLKSTPPGDSSAALVTTSKGRRQILRRGRLLDREGPQLLRAYRSKINLDLLWSIADEARTLRQLLRAPKQSRDIRLIHRQSDIVEDMLQRHLGKFRKSPSRQSTEAIVFALVIALFIRTFVFEPYRIPSGSMIPTLRVGDFIFVSKFVYGIKIPYTDIEFFTWRQPKRGEVVIFDHPIPGPSHGETLIKRVMAVPGDKVRMVDNLWHVNEEPVATRVVARGLDESGKLTNECLPSPGEVCEWYPAEVTFSDAGGTIHAEGDPRAGCPCNVLEESANGHVWNTQHIDPGVVCACSPPGKTLFGDCSLSALVSNDPPGEKSQVHVNWPNWPNQRDPAQYAPWRGWTWDNPSSAERFAEAARNGTSIEVPEGHVLVMGDNRDHSSDGRIWGLVPITRVRGKAGFIWIATEDVLSRIFRSVH